jgi:hypothetical protein
MSILQYLCEFFFTNFWHWAGVVVILAFITRLLVLIVTGK